MAAAEDVVLVLQGWSLGQDYSMWKSVVRFERRLRRETCHDCLEHYLMHYGNA